MTAFGVMMTTILIEVTYTIYTTILESRLPAVVSGTSRNA